MTGILPALLLLILLASALYLVAARPHLVAAWLYRLLRSEDPWSWRARLRARLLAVSEDRDPYPPEAADVYDAEPRCSPAAPDPVDEHFSSVYVEGGHPRDCALACCREIRLNELVAGFDWHAYEHEMRKTK